MLRDVKKIRTHSCSVASLRVVLWLGKKVKKITEGGWVIKSINCHLYSLRKPVSDVSIKITDGSEDGEETQKDEEIFPIQP